MESLLQVRDSLRVGVKLRTGGGVKQLPLLVSWAAADGAGVTASQFGGGVTGGRHGGVTTGWGNRPGFRTGVEGGGENMGAAGKGVSAPEDCKGLLWNDLARGPVRRAQVALLELVMYGVVGQDCC